MGIQSKIFWICVINMLMHISKINGDIIMELKKEAQKAQCSFENSPDYENKFHMKCPSTNSKVLIETFFLSRTRIKCYDDINYQEFNKILPNITLGLTQSLTIEDCPLSESLPFANIAQRLGIRIPGALELILSHVTTIPTNLFTGESIANITRLEFQTSLLELPRNIFMSLKMLKTLKLSNNNLRIISEDLLKFNTRLEDINLENNQIEILPSDIFKSLLNLTVIKISGNNIRVLPENLLKKNKKLKRFNLIENRVPLKSIPPKFFADLPELLRVKLECDLEQIPNNSFINSINIEKIDISHNNLKSLPEKLLEKQMHLKELNLSHNSLEFLPRKLLEKNEQLSVFDLSYNKLLYFDGESLSSCGKLEVLRLNDNELQSGNMRHMMPYITNLEVVNLSNNLIKYISKDWKMPYKLHTLNLSNNNFTMLNDYEIVFLYEDLYNRFHTERISYTFQLILANNNISSININPSIIQDMVSRYSGEGYMKIVLNNNPIRCDCKLLNFVKFLIGVNQNYRLQDLVQFPTKNLTCTEPQNYNKKLVMSLNPKELLCDYYATCPKECKCWKRSYDMILIVNCTNAKLKSIPDLPNIHELYLNGIELNLENNQITNLPTAQTPGYANVTKLSLAFNNMSSLHSSQLPINLAYLDARGNNLKTLTNVTLMFMIKSKSLQEVYLANNSWICDCDDRSFQRFIQDNLQLFRDFSNMTCGNKAEVTYLKDLSDLCPNERIIYLVLGVFIAVIFLLLALYYKYQLEIKIWLYAHNMCLCFVTEHDVDKHKKYDAFISYSHKDEAFVKRSLVPELENGQPPFKLCVHYRDWLVGSLIPDQIIKSVADSKRTIFLLSTSFIESVWAKMEFKAAHKAALNEGVPRVIIILYDDIGDIEKLDSDLKAYLKMNTYLKWGDPWFWKRLRYAMPHIRISTSNPHNMSLQDLRRYKDTQRN